MKLRILRHASYPEGITSIAPVNATASCHARNSLKRPKGRIFATRLVGPNLAQTIRKTSSFSISFTNNSRAATGSWSTMMSSIVFRNRATSQLYHGSSSITAERATG